MKLLDQEMMQKQSACIRILTTDAIESAGSGHPGMPLGMADVMTVLAFNHLKFDQSMPDWLGRDRLILSAGHGSMLLYSFLYLSGYENISLNDIKNFRTHKTKICTGHPEYKSHPAIEVTTGPLGFGLAAAVGMAIAGKKYSQKFKESTHSSSNLFDYKIYVIVGDGCLMEGATYEALSLAGHLKLDNLVIIFDNNKISIDGPTNLTISEDQINKMKSLGFATFTADGHNFAEIDQAFTYANTQEKPSFISFDTIIGYGATTNFGTNKCHGSPLGKGEADVLRSYIGSNGSFNLPKHIVNNWRASGSSRKNERLKWYEKFNQLSMEPSSKDQGQSQENLQRYFMQKSRLNFSSPEIQYRTISTSAKGTFESTRQSAGYIIGKSLQNNNKLILGSADLGKSNCLITSNTKAICSNDFSGNYIHFGVREHAMAAICCGLELSGFNTICASFLAFSDFMRPAMRLAAMMGLSNLFLFTHDSIGVGADGPTHQPVEQLSSLRCVPNIKLYRPADYFETYSCLQKIADESDLDQSFGPSVLVLSRQDLPQINSAPINFKNGSYFIHQRKCVTADYLIISTGSELNLALQITDILKDKGYATSLLSAPCLNSLYNSKFLKEIQSAAKKIIAIEASNEFSWHQIISNKGIFFGVNEYGHSASADFLYEYFGLTAEQILSSIEKLDNID